MKRQRWEWRALGIATALLILAVVLLWCHIIGRWTFAMVALLVAAVFGALTFRPDQPPERREAQHRRRQQR